MENYFNILNSIDVGEHIEKKNGLSYLSWAWAWRELKNKFPDSTYTIYEDEQGRFYHTDGKTCWVKTSCNGLSESVDTSGKGHQLQCQYSNPAQFNKSSGAAWAGPVCLCRRRPAGRKNGDKSSRDKSSKPQNQNGGSPLSGMWKRSKTGKI